ncbi:hypothetical protein [Streptomyces sp. NPDC050982]|uniref:hypothetical protein n=1 Tax=Streptomyces sp. NPDC050982 TaxID=3154746 RepID=UPI0033E21883
MATSRTPPQALAGAVERAGQDVLQGRDRLLLRSGAHAAQRSCDVLAVDQDVDERIQWAVVHI